MAAISREAISPPYPKTPARIETFRWTPTIVIRPAISTVVIQGL